MGLDTLLNISHKYGSDPNFVLAGGGNTSYKEGDTLYIKGSGTALATITKDQFVKMSRSALTKMWTRKYPENEALREAQVLRDMLDARLPGEEQKRPSVETLLHHLFMQPYVLHVHPAMVNGLCCGQDGEKIMQLLFHEAVFVPSTRPGYTLALHCRKLMDRYINRYARYPRLLFLENHGIFFAANSEEELDALVRNVFLRLRGLIKQTPDFSPVQSDAAHTTLIAPALRMLFGGQNAKVCFTANKELLAFAQSEKTFAPLSLPFTPDQIVYCKAAPLYVPYRAQEKEQLALLRERFASFVRKNGYAPVTVFVQNVGMFTCGQTQKQAQIAAAVETDAAAVAVYTNAFGGPKHMDEDLICFISHWEAESYRAGLNADTAQKSEISGKIALIAEACAPFGRAAAAALVRGGATLTLADPDQKKGERLLAHLKKIRPEAQITFACVNCTGEEKLKELIDDIVLQHGGLDLVIALCSGNAEEHATQHENAIFHALCKIASRPMQVQHAIAPQQLFDIIAVGARVDGMAQAAREHLGHGIKINALRPSRDEITPMGRAIRDEDLTRALLYLIEQQFETAMVLPVAGGYRLRQQN